MAVFEYAGCDERGAPAAGELDAAGLIEAAAALRARGLTLTRLAPRAKAAAAPEEIDVFAWFNRSLADLSRLGLPLARAVKDASAGLRRGRFRAAAERMEAKLREGVPPGEAARALEGEAPPYYAAMVRAGVASGRLPEVLEAVSRDTLGLRRVRRALVGALLYPGLVVGLGLLFSAAFLSFYLPVYDVLHRRTELAPSGFTRLLSAAAPWLPAIAAGLLAAAALLGRALADVLPWMGRARRSLALARLLGALSVLTRAGVPLPEAFPLALGATGRRSMARATERLAAKAREGAGLAALLDGTPDVPSELGACVAWAERSNRVPDAARELADHFGARAARDAETLFAVLMPASLVLAGAGLLALLCVLLAPYASVLEGIGR